MVADPSHRRTRLGLPPAPSTPGLTATAAALVCMLVLALAVALAADRAAGHWQAGDPAGLTVQVPQAGGATPDGGTRRDKVLAILRATANVASARALSEGALADLLRPFLGSGAEALSLPLPGVIEVALAGPLADPAGLAAQLAAAAPGTVMEAEAAWATPLRGLARRVRLMALGWLLAVALAGAAVLVAASRGGKPLQADIAATLHELGASDGFIATYLATASLRQGLLGGGLGAILALSCLFVLSTLAAPLLGAPLWPDLLAAPPIAHPGIAHPGIAHPGIAHPLVARLLNTPWRQLPGAIPWAFWAGLFAAVAATALLPWLATRRALRRLLRRLP